MLALAKYLFPDECVEVVYAVDEVDAEKDRVGTGGRCIDGDAVRFMIVKGGQGGASPEEPSYFKILECQTRPTWISTTSRVADYDNKGYILQHTPHSQRATSALLSCSAANPRFVLVHITVSTMLPHPTSVQ